MSHFVIIPPSILLRAYLTSLLLLRQDDVSLPRALGTVGGKVCRTGEGEFYPRNSLDCVHAMAPGAEIGNQNAIGGDRSMRPDETALDTFTFLE